MGLDNKMKQDMESGLEHVARVVQTRFSQFEQNVFVPVLESSRSFAAEYPITATFISFFVILSVFPVASFIGFVILVSTTVSFIAFAGAFIVSTALIIIAAALLALILSVLFLASIFLTIAALSSFAAVRLGQYLRSSPNVKQGFVDWGHETRNRFKWRAAADSTGVVITKEEPTKTSGPDEWQAVDPS